MLNNYIKIALRNVFKNKMYFFINVLGLTVGLTCFILIFLWLQNELSYDKFHEKSASIYRVYLKRIYSGNKISTHFESPAPLSSFLKENYPEIINATTMKIIDQKLVFRYIDKLFYEEKGYLCDADTLEIFSFPFLIGNFKFAFSEPYSIILTRDMANKYFGNVNPLDKYIKINNKFDFKVTGVIENIPSNSHLQFDFLLPLSFFEKLENYPLNRWDNNSFYSYLLLKNGSSSQEIGNKIQNVIKYHLKKSTAEIYLFPLVKTHLYSIEGEDAIKYLHFFSITAFLILIISCANFINLSIAISTKRTKEIGIRKVLGANQSTLIMQFLLEYVLLVIIVLIISLYFAKMFLSGFNQILGIQLKLSLFENYRIFILLGIAVFIGICSGIYPAFFLASFNPTSVLKHTTIKSNPRSFIRKILVAIQFIISISLIISTIVIYKQVHYLKSKDIGYNKNNIVYLEVGDDFGRKYIPMRNELLQIPNVINVTASNEMPINSKFSTNDVDWEGKYSNEKLKFQLYFVDYEYIETFQMRMVHGRSFIKNFSTDNINFILNEEAVKQINLNPAIGKYFSLWNHKGTIIGIVKNFNFRPLQSEIEPLIMKIEPSRFNVIAMRIKNEDIKSTMNYIEKVWIKYNPGFPCQIKFFEDDFKLLYETENKMGIILGSFSFLAIFISCLGLLGLAFFVIDQRFKEIAIRKLIGSSISKIVLLLTTEFAKVVLFANFIAWPISYLVMNNWIKDYAYRTTFSWWIFILAGIFVLLTTFFTIIFQGIKAAKTNPIDALRS